MRNTDNYKVMFANTERLKKSSILDLQRQLNEEENKKRNIGLVIILFSSVLKTMTGLPN